MSGAGSLLVLNAGSTGLKASLHAAGGRCRWREQRSWQELGGVPGGEPAAGREVTGASGSAAIAAEPGAAEDGSGVAGTAAAAPEAPEDHDPASGPLLRWLKEALRAQAGAGEESAARPVLVAHRLVHGGERFTAPTRLDPAALAALAALTPLAPLHNGPALALIQLLRRHWPELPQWACFDTAFHASLPPEAFTYAIPETWRRDGLRRFGFHGLNHQHVAEVVAQRFGVGALPGGEGPGGRDGGLRLISCHLGGGCSLCAIRDGRSIATTMGFTPLEGLVMATRSGSLDPGLLLHQLRRGLEPAEIERALQREGGLLGLSGLSASMQELRAAAAAPPEGQGHAGAALAIAVFRRRLLEGIGAMAACLGGVDVIALSGGIGEHDQALRAELAEALRWLGRFELLVVPADEEGVIARSCGAAAAATTAARA